MLEDSSTDNLKLSGLPVGAYPKRVTAGFRRDPASLAPPAFFHQATSPLQVAHAGHCGTPCEAIVRDAVTVHLAHPDVAAGSSLNGTRSMSVGVAAKPPDESFRRLETAPLDSLSPYALPYGPRSSEEGAQRMWQRDSMAYAMIGLLTDSARCS